MVNLLHPTPPAAKRKRSSPDISPVDRGNPPAKKPKTINSTTPSITKGKRNSALLPFQLQRGRLTDFIQHTRPSVPRSRDFNPSHPHDKMQKQARQSKKT